MIDGLCGARASRYVASRPSSAASTPVRAGRVTASEPALIYVSPMPHLQGVDGPCRIIDGIEDPVPTLRTLYTLVAPASFSHPRGLDSFANAAMRPTIR